MKSVASKLGWFLLTFGTIISTLIGWIYLIVAPAMFFTGFVLFPIIYGISEWELLLSRDITALAIIAMPFLYIYWKITHLKKKLKNPNNIQTAADCKYCRICGDNIGVNSMVNHYLRYHKIFRNKSWIIKYSGQICLSMIVVGFLIFAGVQCSKQHRVEHGKLEVGELCITCGNYKEAVVIDCTTGHNWGKYKTINLTVTKRGNNDFEVLSTKEIQIQRRHCKTCGIKQDT